MTFRWYKIFNIEEFSALELISKTYTFFLEGVGQKDILVTVGETVGITYEGVFLPVTIETKNPYIRDGFASYKHTNGDVYLGVEVT